MSLKKTSLHQEHLDLKAKMGPFAGFEMPIQYSNVKDEVYSVRKNAGVFDVSHMGEFFFEGEEAEKCVDYLFVNDIKNAPNGKAVYTPMCRENGTVIDDMIVYKIHSKRILVCVNASNIEKDFSHMSSVAQKFNCTLTDHSSEYSLLAVQGPNAISTLEKKVGIAPIDELEYYSLKEIEIEGSKIIVARTGYTGEDGVELFMPHDFAKKTWDNLLANDVKPCGLASRDVLRLEVCFPLYGHEISDDVTPLDSALKWTVKFSKADFLGKETLETYKPKYRLIKLTMDKGIPRQDYPILNDQDEVIGKVTSGTFSPSIEKGIALAHVEKEKFSENQEFKIKIRNQIFPCLFHKKAFVTGGHK